MKKKALKKAKTPWKLVSMETCVHANFINQSQSLKPVNC
jgi:hypothetical protein